MAEVPKEPRGVKKRKDIIELPDGAATGWATSPKYGLWSKTMCKLGFHRSDGWPKRLACCRDCDMWPIYKDGKDELG